MPHRTQTGRRALAFFLFMLSVAVVTAIVAILVLNHVGRVDQWQDDYANCLATQKARVDVISREQDLHGLAVDLQEFVIRAQDAWLSTGTAVGRQTAASYMPIRQHSLRRAKRSRARMLRAIQRRNVPCMMRYPKPGFLR